MFRQTAEETFPGCEGAPEPATALRAEVRAARGARHRGGGGRRQSWVASGGALLAAVLEFGGDETRVETRVRRSYDRVTYGSVVAIV